MPRIPMTGGYARLPEGEQVLRIYDVNYDEEFGKLDVHFVNAQGITQKETYSLKTNENEWNEGACNAFSFLAQTALNEFGREEVDPEELIGRYIKADVYYSDPEPSTRNPEKMVSYVRLGDKTFADGFEDEPVEKALKLGKGDGFKGKPKEKEKSKAPVEKPKTPVEKPKAKTIDLDSLLG